ncbi:hypothetical protein [Streptomyces sp. NBC_00454]|uniref:hypothetical protein n=1 Tax=Streptomyces sp. NBC_00454 TaxID=2975747 RepID=UPI0030E5D370
MKDCAATIAVSFTEPVAAREIPQPAPDCQLDRWDFSDLLADFDTRLTTAHA